MKTVVYWVLKNSSGGPYWTPQGWSYERAFAQTWTTRPSRKFMREQGFGRCIWVRVTVRVK